MVLHNVKSSMAEYLLMWAPSKREGRKKTTTFMWNKPKLEPNLDLSSLCTEAEVAVFAEKLKKDAPLHMETK